VRGRIALAVPACERPDFLGDAAPAANHGSAPRFLWARVFGAASGARGVQGRHGVSRGTDWSENPVESIGKAAGISGRGLFGAAHRRSVQGNFVSGKLPGLRGGPSPIPDLIAQY